MRTVFDKYWIPVTESGCWLWTGGINSRGYGNFAVNKKTRSAHRVAYELYVGPIPEGLLIRHKCDTKSCVNPNHLVPGTVKQNSQDMVDRKRNRHGAAHHFGKFSRELVEQVLSASGTVQEIGKRFGMSFQHVSSIKRGYRRQQETEKM